MCKVADAAMAMVNRSIELAWETRNESYYMDFVKRSEERRVGKEC